MHRYGPHIFHTNAPKVSDYLSRFTNWRAYEHRVLAVVDERLVPLPINRTTLNRIYGLDLDDERAVEAYLAAAAEPSERIDTSEQAVVSKVGRDLYERLYRGYTRKQWALDPSQLDASVCARIPIRTNTDDRYFTDGFQYMPAAGYTAMFEQILDHPLIEVRTGVDFANVRDRVRWQTLVWTGPIDAYFDHSLGALPYRSLEFTMETRATPDGGTIQPVAQVNFPCESVAHTRVTEYRHMTGQRAQDLDSQLRVPSRRRPAVLPGAAVGEPAALRPLSQAGGHRARRRVCRPAGSIPVSEHGPGGRAGTRCLAGDVWRA